MPNRSINLSGGKHLFTLIVLVLSVFSCSIKTNDTKPPNIVIILSDDQGWGDLSLNGNTNLETPNLDKMAQSGALFDRFYVCPVCSPTRAELLTGRYSARGGVYSTSAGGERLDADETTLADVFKQAGYQTAAYGKWHNGMQAPYHPNARGFDDFYGFCSGHWGNYFSPMLEHNGQIVTGEGFIIDDLTNHGIRFMEKNHDQPFLLYLPFNTPHSPMQVPERWWSKFEHKDLAMRNRNPDAENLNHTRAALAMCENIDWNVGRIMAKIEELGIADNTIVLYFSDNGPNGVRWNGDMKGRKGSTDEGGVRSPLLMKWDKHIRPGMQVKQIAGAIDLLPTLADLTGIDFNPEKALDGKSLKPLLLEQNSTWPDRNIFSAWNKKVSVRNQKYRLDADNNLFDMENDPGQHTDISAQSPEIQQQLVEAKQTWTNTVYAELPQFDERTFTIGHPDFLYTQIPARDGTAHGNIVRSNKYPNCSFFTNWISTDDSITWESEVLADGDFDVEIYYTCPEDALGAVFELSFNGEKVTGQFTEANNPPLTGMENDRDPRIESYVKDFKPYQMGTLHLSKGKGTLTLKALEIPGSQVMDFRLLMLKRRT